MIPPGFCLFPFLSFFCLLLLGGSTESPFSCGQTWSIMLTLGTLYYILSFPITPFVTIGFVQGFSI
ncbi:hypothetical protein F4818DRAFT_418302 [Hypoxylon cercidicola]|nr:hypothetical protein F4818DRAFT_418302 [Hypoxylon cercidicola]